MGGTLVFMEIGEVVATIRKAQRLTQDELASAVADDYHQANISRFERGWKGISVADLERIADRLGVTVADIYHLTTIPKTDPKWRAWLRVYGNLDEQQIDLVLALGRK